jgi:hypothetical protein
MEEQPTSQPATGESATPAQESQPENAPPQQPAENRTAQAPPTGQPPGEGYTLPPLPPGYAVEPATGRIFYVGPVAGASVPPGGYGQAPQAPPSPPPGGGEAARHQYGQLVNTVQRFIDGEASVADVVSTVYTASAQDDQLWKGILVGAAAAVLLTSEPVRQAMGRTFARPAAADPPQPAAAPVAAADAPVQNTAQQPTPTKE